MIQDEKYPNHWTASAGMVIISKGDTLSEEKSTYDTQTKSLWLSKFDSIENYMEVAEPIENEKSESFSV